MNPLLAELSCSKGRFKYLILPRIVGSLKGGNRKREDGGKMKAPSDTTKYLIHAEIVADGVVEKPDVVGAIFRGQASLSTDISKNTSEYLPKDDDF